MRRVCAGWPGSRLTGPGIPPGTRKEAAPATCLLTASGWGGWGGLRGAPQGQRGCSGPEARVAFPHHILKVKGDTGLALVWSGAGRPALMGRQPSHTGPECEGTAGQGCLRGRVQGDSRRPARVSLTPCPAGICKLYSEPREGVLPAGLVLTAYPRLVGAHVRTHTHAHACSCVHTETQDFPYKAVTYKTSISTFIPYKRLLARASSHVLVSC